MFILAQVIQHDQRNILVKWIFDTRSRFWPSLIILLCIPHFTTSSPFRALKLLFGKCLYHGLLSCLPWSDEHFDKIFFHTISRHIPIASIVTSFCYILLIQKLRRLFEQLHFIFNPIPNGGVFLPPKRTFPNIWNIRVVNDRHLIFSQ